MCQILYTEYRKYFITDCLEIQKKRKNTSIERKVPENTVLLNKINKQTNKQKKQKKQKTTTTTTWETGGFESEKFRFKIQRDKLGISTDKHVLLTAAGSCLKINSTPRCDQ